MYIFICRNWKYMYIILPPNLFLNQTQVMLIKISLKHDVVIIWCGQGTGLEYWTGLLTLIIHVGANCINNYYICTINDFTTLIAHKF